MQVQSSKEIYTCIYTIYAVVNFEFLYQDEDTDDELEGEDLQQVEGELVDSPNNPQPSTPRGILHISEEDANLLLGSLTNDCNRKLIKVQNTHHLYHH